MFGSHLSASIQIGQEVDFDVSWTSESDGKRVHRIRLSKKFNGVTRRNTSLIYYHVYCIHMFIAFENDVVTRVNFCWVSFKHLGLYLVMLRMKTNDQTKKRNEIHWELHACALRVCFLHLGNTLYFVFPFRFNGFLFFSKAYELIPHNNSSKLNEMWKKISLLIRTLSLDLCFAGKRAKTRANIQMKPTLSSELNDFNCWLDKTKDVIQNGV